MPATTAGTVVPAQRGRRDCDLLAQAHRSWPTNNVALWSITQCFYVHKF